MHGYKEFPEDVKTFYDFIISEHGFRVTSESHSEVVLASANYVVSITTEYDYAQFTFRPAGSDTWEFLGPTIEGSYPGVMIPPPPSAIGLSRVERIRSYLKYQAGIVREYFGFLVPRVT